MPGILVQSPFEYFTDQNGRALINGRIYIGLPNQDPVQFPQAVFYDAAMTIPAQQPIKTNSGGYPSDSSGNAQRLFTAGAYSIYVTDQNGANVLSAANSVDGFYGVVASDLANNTDPTKGSDLVGYILQTGATGTTVHDKIERIVVDIKDFGAAGNGTANDSAAFTAAAALGRAILLPAGNYNVPTGNFSNVKFYSYDGATCTNSTVSIVDPLSNSLSVGTRASFPCLPSALPFGWLHENGQVVNRSVYPQLWAFANTSGNIVDEVDKINNPTAFGRGNGTSTFSLPDFRGVNSGFADASRGLDTSFVLGKIITVSAASAAPGISVRTGISTPAIRAFGSAVNQGSIDIQALQTQVNTNSNDIIALQSGKANAIQGANAWASMFCDPTTGTYSQTGTTVTVTITSHGMSTGMYAYLNFTSGTAVDGYFQVTVTGVNTFTVTALAPLTTSGNVSRELYVLSSYNVASVSRAGGGLNDVVFSVSRPNAFYAVQASASISRTTGGARIAGTLNKSTSGFRLETVTGAGAAADCQVVDFAVFG